MPTLTPLLLGAALLLTPAAASVDPVTGPTQDVRISPGASMVVPVAQRLTEPYSGLLSENISVKEGECTAAYAYSPGTGDSVEITAHGDLGDTCVVGYAPHDPQTNEPAPAELAGTIMVSIEAVPVPAAPAPQPSSTKKAATPVVDSQPTPAPPEEPRWRHPVVPVAGLAVLGLGAALALGLRRESSL